MDVDDDGLLRTEIPDWGIAIDYDILPDDLRGDDDGVERELLHEIKELSDELEHMAPNMKAVDRLGVVTDRLRETDREFEDARKNAKSVKERFLAAKQERHNPFQSYTNSRYDKFMEAFEHIRGQIDPIYKELTRSENFKQGGSAYLTLEDSEVIPIHRLSNVRNLISTVSNTTPCPR
jgi:structural maintenance of chromosome 1